MDGFTALHNAALKGREGIVRAILRHAAGLPEEELGKRLTDPGVPPSSSSSSSSSSSISSSISSSPFACSTIPSSSRPHPAPLSLPPPAPPALPPSLLLLLTARTDKGNTPLHLAAQAGHLPTVLSLLSFSSSLSLPLSILLDARNILGGTPLHNACWGRKKDVIKCLKDRGADIHALTHDGRSAADMLVGEKEGRVAEALRAVVEREDVSSYEREAGREDRFERW